MAGEALKLDVVLHKNTINYGLTMDTLSAIVPEELNDTVIRFCSMISQQQPVYIPIKPESYSLPGSCFPNVEDKISRDGGEIVYVWKIWLFQKFFIEAEFHSIWKSPEGACIDITPDEPSFLKVLFVPDERKKFTGKRVDNIRYNFSGNRLVDLYIGIARCLFFITEYDSKPYVYSRSLKGDEQEIIKEIDFWSIQITSMLRNGVSRNAPCPCGSGIKFKSCCEKRLLKLIEYIKKNYALS